MLIFDNAEEPAALARYLPGGGGQVVITSRNPGWHELATPVRMDVFDREESITLQLHQLLAAILRTQSHQQPDLPTLAVRLLRTAVPADNPWDNPPAWPAWRQLLPHVLAVTDRHRTLDTVAEDVAWLLEHAAEYLHTRGEPAPARPLRERALGLRRSRLGDNHPDTLDSASNLAVDLWVLGHYEQARQLAGDALTRMRQVLGDDHSDTLRSTRSLAAALADPGENDAES